MSNIIPSSGGLVIIFPQISYQISFFMFIYLSPQAIQNVDEFVSSSDLEKYSIASLALLWIICSEWVPSEWESCEVKRWVLARNKTIFKAFLTSKFSFQVKYESIIHNNAFTSKNVMSPDSGEKYAQMYCLQIKTALHKYASGFWCERMTSDGLSHWRKHYYWLIF